jgi:hypothetical protein
MSTQTYTLHTGPLTGPLTSPSLDFISLYAAQVDTLDLSGPYSTWYSHKSLFYNPDGTIHNGGSAIWTYMRGLFGPFEKVEHTILKTWVLQSVDVKEGEGGESKKGDLVMMDCITSFWVKGIKGGAIRVPRLLSFVVGEAEEGMGMDGLWILEAKVWWDSGVLGREIERRKAKLVEEE